MTDEGGAPVGAMRLEWTFGATPVLDGTWSWAVHDRSLDATGTVRALELGDAVVAVFTLATPIRCAAGDTIPLFSAIVRVQAGSLVGTIGGGGACELRRFELTRDVS